MDKQDLKIQKLTSQCETLPNDRFNTLVDNMDKSDLEEIARRFYKIKNYYEKNLTMFPEFTKTGDKHYIFTSSKKKLKRIKERGKYIIQTINNK